MDGGTARVKRLSPSPGIEGVWPPHAPLALSLEKGIGGCQKTYFLNCFMKMLTFRLLLGSRRVICNEKKSRMTLKCGKNEKGGRGAVRQINELTRQRNARKDLSLRASLFSLALCHKTVSNE